MQEWSTFVAATRDTENGHGERKGELIQPDGGLADHRGKGVVVSKRLNHQVVGSRNKRREIVSLVRLSSASNLCTGGLYYLAVIKV